MKIIIITAFATAWAYIARMIRRERKSS
jgi:hypothetical protein